MTTFVDLFCGAGGLSLGLQNAGWIPLLAVDYWSDAIQTYRNNFTGHSVVEEDLSRMTGPKLREYVNGSPDWVVGGPPCQGFSTVGKRERDDPRNQLVRQFARIVSILEPRGILVENVVGLRDMDFVTSVSKLFEDMGYHMTSVVVRSADYGVPQLRHRLFFVGRRLSGRFVPPKPSHRPDSYVSVWDAISDLPELLPGQESGSYASRPMTAYQRRIRQGSTHLQGHVASNHPDHLVKAISFIPDGGNRQHIPAEYQPASGFHNSYSRLHSGSPAVAITQNMGKPSGTRCIHPFQNRGLTAREGARLQGFPDAFHFCCGVTSQRLQIANAVSPILAEVMGKALVDKRSWRVEEKPRSKQGSFAFADVG